MRAVCAFAVITILATAAAGEEEVWEPPGKWSLAERQAWTKLREEMNVYLKDANDRCGTRIVADFNYESFRGKFKEGESYGLDAYGRAHIQVPINAVENICKIGDREKVTVGRGVRKIMFVHGRKGGKAKSTINLRRGQVTAVIEPEGEAAGRWLDDIERYLKKHL